MNINKDQTIDDCLKEIIEGDETIEARVKRFTVYCKENNFVYATAMMICMEIALDCSSRTLGDTIKENLQEIL